MSKKQPKPESGHDDDKDVLHELGEFIEKNAKKIGSKVERLFDDSKDADDKLFSYFKVFMDDKGVASVTPSSKYVVERVLKAMDVRNTKYIIEYGAASGPVTRGILNQMPQDGKLIAIELNEKLFEQLKNDIKDPRMIPVNGDVRKVKEIAREHGFPEGQVDAITSGIPFAFLSGRGRHELLRDTHDLLKPGGRFVPYQVTTHLVGLLDEYFRKVKTQFEIRNIPPHFVFTAYK